MKKVALIGLGAMGSFFAPRLDEYLGRENFYVIADGERKERLETKGVTINGINYKFNIVDSKKGEPVDLIIMAVKDTGLKKAIDDIEKFVGDNTQILCVMNGIESEELLIEKYGESHVLYSYMRVSIVMTDGVCDFDPEKGKVFFGEKSNVGEHTKRVREIEELFSFAKIPYCVLDDMISGMWFKYACNIGENMTCALLGIPFGAYTKSDFANAIRVAGMKEVQAIAKCKGVNLTDEQLEKQAETLKVLPAKNIPSTFQDLLAHKKTEVEMFAGTVVRMGKEFGIPTPVNWMFYNGIKTLEEKNKGEF